MCCSKMRDGVWLKTNHHAIKQKIQFQKVLLKEGWSPDSMAFPKCSTKFLLPKRLESGCNQVGNPYFRQDRQRWWRQRRCRCTGPQQRWPCTRVFQRRGRCHSDPWWTPPLLHELETQQGKEIISGDISQQTPLWKISPEIPQKDSYLNCSRTTACNTKLFPTSVSAHQQAQKIKTHKTLRFRFE